MYTPPLLMHGEYLHLCGCIPVHDGYYTFDYHIVLLCDTVTDYITGYVICTEKPVSFGVHQHYMLMATG